jgi:hypothetical protein
MPGPYYANTTQKKKAVLLSQPARKSPCDHPRGECWQVRIIALHLYPDTPDTNARQYPRYYRWMNIEKSCGICGSFGPFDIIATISSCCLGLSFGRRPDATLLYGQRPVQPLFAHGESLFQTQQVLSPMEIVDGNFVSETSLYPLLSMKHAFVCGTGL